jgi:membrane fusion protein, copper/silver efflux system
MKPLPVILTTILLLNLKTNVFAQHKNHATASSQTVSTADSGKVDKSVKNQLNAVLLRYYELKDAFVKTDAKKSVEQAKRFQTALDKVETTKMTLVQQEFFKKTAEKLRSDASQIQALADVNAQREHFETLSLNLLTLVKTLKFNQEPVYQQFCPMAFDNKGAFWLSDEKQIMNPYFGNNMLHCGSVKGTF